MRSDMVKKGFQRSPHRGLLHACGVSDSDMNKPFIGVANSFCEIVPGHVHLDEVARVVKKSVREAGGVPFEFNTIAICDGIAMGHTGMKYTLIQLRQWYALTVLTVLFVSQTVIKSCPGC